MRSLSGKYIESVGHICESDFAPIVLVSEVYWSVSHTQDRSEHSLIDQMIDNILVKISIFADTLTWVFFTPTLEFSSLLLVDG